MRWSYREATNAAESVSARGAYEEEICDRDDRVECEGWGVSEWRPGVASRSRDVVC